MDTKEFPREMLPTITRRYLATVIDGLFLWSIFLILAITLEGDKGLLPKIRVGIAFLIWVTYEPFFTSRFCTVGQKALSVRVRTMAAGERISLLQAYSRFVVKIILGWISFFSIPFSRGRRAIHDQSGGSLVVSADALSVFGKDGVEPWPEFPTTTSDYPDFDHAARIKHEALNTKFSAANICLVCREGIGSFDLHEDVTFRHQSFKCIGVVHEKCRSLFDDAVEGGETAGLFTGNFE